MSIEYYKSLFITTNLLPPSSIDSLKFAVYTKRCEHCLQLLRLAKLGCGHSICVDCLDALVDIKDQRCPVCSSYFENFEYL
jgi:hypothetical protein